MPRPARLRNLAAALGIILVCANAAAAEPGTVTGRLTYEGKVYSLQHVYAWQPPFQDDELWIYVTDNPLPDTAARHESMPERLAREKRFGGVKLVIRPVKPRLDDMKGVDYAPRDDGFSVDKFNFGPSWQALTVGDRCVVGNAQTRWMNWTLDVEFSAPVFGSTGMVRTILGQAAQNSPQADRARRYRRRLRRTGRRHEAGRPARRAARQERGRLEKRGVVTDRQAKRLS